MINPVSPQLVEKIRQNVNQQRLLDTAMALIDIPSPTLSAGEVADQLASLLQDDGFEVVQVDVEPLDVYFGRTFLVHNKGSNSNPF